MPQENAAKPPPGDPSPQQEQRADAATNLPEPKGKTRTRTLVVERRRGFVRRWLGRLVALVMILGILFMIALVSLTILLRSDLPRSLAESAATQALGLELTLGELEIGWGGRITVRNFTARLPDFGQVAGEDLLKVEHIQAELDSLPLVALNYLRGRRPTLKRVVIDSPTVYATQSASGQWNLARAFTLVTSVRAGSASGTEAASVDLPPLPALQLTDGALVIRTSDGREVRLGGLDLSGSRENPLVYRLSGGSESKLRISGELFPASGRRQQIKLELAGLDENLRSLFELPEATLYANWTGGLTNDGFEGMLQIQSGSVDEMRVSGGLRIAASSGVTRIWPVDLQAQGLKRIGDAIIPQGEIRIDSAVHAEGLLIGMLGGHVLVRSAFFDPANLGGELDVLFRDISPGGQDILSGEVIARAGYDEFGEPFAAVQLLASGQLGEANFQNLSAEVQADGPTIGDWGTLDMAVRLREAAALSVGGEVTTMLPPLEVPIRVRLSDAANPRIEVPELRSLDPEALELAGNAVYYADEGADHAAGEWWLSLWQRGLPLKLPRLDEPLPTQLSLEAEGRLAQAGAQSRTSYIRMAHFFGAVGAAAVSGSGEYVINGPAGIPPLMLDLTLRRDISLAPAHFQQVHGSLLGMFSITGDPTTLEFTGTGGVEADGLVIGEMAIGRIRSDISLTLTKSLLTISTLHDAGRFRQRTEVLGAYVDLDAEIPLSADQIGHLRLAIEQMDLEQVVDGLALPLAIAGSVNGEMHVDLAGLSLEQARARGWLAVDDLFIPGLEIADRVVIGVLPAQAEDADPRGGLIFSNGELQLPVEVVQLMDVAPGPTTVSEARRMSFGVSYNMNRPWRIELLNIQSDGYPFEYPAREDQGRYLHLEVSIQPSELTIELAGPPQVRGEFVAAAEISTGIEPFDLNHLGAAEMTLTALNTRIDITELLVDLGEVGDITGEGTLDLNDLAGRSRLLLQGSALNLEALARELSIPEGAAGVADVSLLIQPGQGTARHGEVVVDFSFAGEEARWRDLQIGQGQIIAYASRTRHAPESGFDFDLMTTERLHLQIAGGVMDGYARLRNRGGGGAQDQWHVNGTLQATALDLSQIGATLDQNMEGRVDLRLAAFGNLSPTPRFGETREDLPWLPVNGEATVGVRRGELRRFNLFNRILKLTNLTGNAAQQDWLDARVRLEHGDAYVENLVASVDGIEIRMAGTIDDVLNPRQATIAASGVVLARPLSQIRLPFFAEADDILSAVQSTAGTDTYRASGLLLDPNVVPVAWDQMGETLRVLLSPASRR